MDTLTTLADLGIGWRPLTRLCQVQVKALIAVLVRNIKVDDDMVLRHLDIVEFRGIQLRKSLRDFFPFLRGRFFRCGILSRTVRTIFVECGYCSIKLNQPSCGLRLINDGLFLKFFSSEATVIAPNTSSIFHTEALCVVMEIVLQLFLERSLAEGVRDLCFLIIGLIHLPSSLEGRSVFTLEDWVGINDVVVEVIGGSQHSNRNITVVVSGIFQINLLTVVSNRAKFKRDVLHDGLVLVRLDLISCWGNINQTSNQTGFSVRNTNRFVCAHKEESLKTVGVS